MQKILISLLFVLCSTTVFAAKEFPLYPDNKQTPGTTCTTPTEYRYPEKIAYCKRDVSSKLKNQIFENYRQLGYVLPPEERSSYKIDHYIPLCAGGSNDVTNLWPQHLTVFKITDQLEQYGCEELAAGNIKQADLIALIIKVKNDLSLIDQALDQIGRR